MKRRFLSAISPLPGRPNFALLFLVGTIALGHLRAQTPLPSPEGVLYLSNGDRLRGKIAALDPDRLTLLHPLSGAPIVIRTDELIAFIARERFGLPGEGGQWIISTHQNDRFRAQSLELTGEALMIHHPWLGRLTLPRQAVRSVERAFPAAVLYAGPRKGEKWWLGTEQKVLADDTVANNSVMPLGFVFDKVPPRSRVDAVLDMPPTGLVIFWLGEKPQTGSTESGDFYQFQFLGEQVVVFRNSRQTKNIQLARVQINPREDESGQPRRLTLFTDVDTGRLAMVIDNQLVGEWKDPERFDKPGRAIAFRTLHGGLLRVRSLRLSEWDGRLPDNTEQNPTAREDVLIVQNRDTVSGSVTRIAGATVHMETPFGALSIPLDHVTRLRLRSPSAPQASDVPRNRIRFSLMDGTEFVAKHIDRDGDAIICVLEDAGAVRLALERLRAIRWKAESRQKGGVQRDGAASRPVLEESSFDDIPLEVW